MAGVRASDQLRVQDVVDRAPWSTVDAVLGERDTDENEQRAYRLIPIQGFAKKRDTDDDGEDGSEVRDTAGYGCWSVAHDVEIENVGDSGAKDP